MLLCGRTVENDNEKNNHLNKNVQREKNSDHLILLIRKSFPEGKVFNSNH